MLNKRVEEVLNEQITKEAYSAQLYLAMASWVEKEGYNGSADFLYRQTEEERGHMLKLFHYINERGGHAVVSALDEPPREFGNIKELFTAVLKHEQYISQAINNLVAICFEEKDYTTNQFLSWYVQEQIEEEKNAQEVLDKLNLLGGDKASKYMFDNDMKNFNKTIGTAI